MFDFGPIAGIGIELEGGDFPEGRNTKGWKEDCSVHCGGEETDDCDCDEEDLRRYGHSDSCGLYDGSNDEGECVSPILRSWGDARDWISDHYPSMFDSSCGMHVHVSFHDPDDYSRLMRDSFNKFFKAEWKKWGWSAAERGFAVGQDVRWFRDRLEGLNTFCTQDFYPDKTFLHTNQSGGEGRYVQLNYRWAYLGTIECRLLPMFKTARRARKSIKKLLKIYKEYLATSLPMEYVRYPVEFDEDSYFNEAHRTLEAKTVNRDEPLFGCEVYTTDEELSI